MGLIVKLLLTILFTVTLNANNIINVDSAIKDIKQNGKNIMLFFHMPGCPYCKRMLDKNFKDTKVLQLIKENFVLVDIYTADSRDVLFNNNKTSPKEFAKTVGATVYPTTLFMDKNGKVYYKAVGYRNIQEYINELKYLSSKSYKKMDLDAYILHLEMSEDDEEY
jgi:thioredoxin-related protein